MPKLTALLCLSALIWACQSSAPKSAESAENSTTQAAPEGTVEPSAPIFASYEAFVTGAAALRREPTKDRRVKDEQGKEVGNWQTTLFRGELVTVLDEKPDWLKVRASDDTEGWILAIAALNAEGVQLATVTTETQTFRRPDVTQLDANTKVSVGSLLMRMREKDQFSEVNFSGSRSYWVSTDRLTTQAEEVAAAKVITKIRQIEDKEPQTKAELLTLAESNFAETVVLKGYKEAEAVVAEAGEEAAEAKPEEAAAAP